MDTVKAMFHQKKSIVFSLLFLAIITIAAYWPVTNHPFINFDDGVYVTHNHHVQQGLTLQNIIWAFSPSTSRGDEKIYWHPLTWISHMTDCQLFGLNPHMHHLTNLFFHVINVLLLFLVLFKATGEIWKSCFVAVLFSLHPINVDSVAWIAERKNLLSTTFWMTTMLAYMYYARRPSIIRYLFVTLSLLLGLLSKPMLVTLPCVLLLMDYWPLNRVQWSQTPLAAYRTSKVASTKPFFVKESWMRLILEKIPLLSLSFITIGLSMITLQSKARVVTNAMAPITIRIENGIVSYVAYLYKIVWPKGLAVFYPYPNVVPLWKVAGAVLLLVAITAFVLRRRRKQPYLVIGWLWFLGVLFPVSGLVQGGLWPAMADRWVYVPCIGIFIMFAWGIPDLIPSKWHFRKAMLSTSALLIIVLSFLFTGRQLSYWANTSTLFNHALAVTKDNYVAYNILGEGFAENGKNEKAEQYYLKAVKIKPNYSVALKNLAILSGQMGHYENAIQYYNSVLLIDPLDYHAIILLADTLRQAGKTGEAINRYREALQTEPANPEIHNNLGVALFDNGEVNLAETEFKKAVRLNPQYAEAYYNLGLIASQQMAPDRAASYYLKAVKFKPDYADAHRNLADIMFSKGNMKAAIQQYDAALRIRPDDAKSLYNIGVILYIQNHPTQAADYFQKALEIDPGYEKAKIALIQIKNMMHKQN